MAIIINGTSGISGVDGSAGTPALQGSDTNTGISFGTDEVNINTGGSTRATVDSSGNVGIGTASPNNNYGTNLAVHDSGTTGARLKLSTSGTGEGNLDGFDVISTGSNAFILNRESGTLALGSNNTTAAEIASGGEFRFNSGYGSVATAFGVRAWVNFNGTGTVSIRASGNVSSITDSGTGKYRANFTNSMPDAYYAAEVTVIKDDAADNNDMYATIGATGVSGRTPTTTYVPITTTRLNTALVDCPVVNVAIIR